MKRKSKISPLWKKIMNLLTQNEKQSLKIIIMFLCGQEEGEHPTQLKLLFLDVSRGLQDIAANQYCNFTADFKNIPKRANSNGILLQHLLFNLGLFCMEQQLGGNIQMHVEGER